LKRRKSGYSRGLDKTSSLFRPCPHLRLLKRSDPLIGVPPPLFRKGRRRPYYATRVPKARVDSEFVLRPTSIELVVTVYLTVKMWINRSRLGRHERPRIFHRASRNRVRTSRLVRRRRPIVKGLAATLAASGAGRLMRSDTRPAGQEARQESRLATPPVRGTGCRADGRTARCEPSTLRACRRRGSARRSSPRSGRPAPTSRDGA